MDARVVELFSQNFVFDIVLAQLPAGYKMFAARKKLGGRPQAGNQGFTHAVLRFPLNDFIEGNRVIRINPKCQLGVGCHFVSIDRF